jgi:hypothetical protein
MLLWGVRLGVKDQRQGCLDHPQALGRSEIVARTVQSSQVAEPQLLDAFSAIPDQRNEHLGAAATFCHRIGTFGSYLDRCQEVVIENLSDPAPRHPGSG